MSKKSVRLMLVDMEKIQEPAHQLRAKITEEGLEELKASLGRVGLINPIRVKQRENGYEIESGHRRYLAARELGWGQINCLIVDEGDGDVKLRSIHENLHREDMSPIEEGKAVAALVSEYGLSLRDVAKMCGKSESWVRGRIDLLDMPAELQEAVDVGALSVGAARELAAITDNDARAYYIEYAIKQGATQQLCQFWRGRWELEKTVNDPSGMAKGAEALGPPPLTIELPCWWCGKGTDIKLIDHLRVCPACREALIQARIEYLRVGSALVAEP